MDFNKVILIGRATGNLQSKTIESNNSVVVNFVIATNRKYKNKEGNIMEEAEYHRCVAYGKSAEVLSKYLNKGKRVFIEGRLRTRKRQDNTGATKYSTEVIVTHFIFLDVKGPEEINENEDSIVHAEEGVPIDEEVPF